MNPAVTKEQFEQIRRYFEHETFYADREEEAMARRLTPAQLQLQDAMAIFVFQAFHVACQQRLCVSSLDEGFEHYTFGLTHDVGCWVVNIWYGQGAYFEIGTIDVFPDGLVAVSGESVGLPNLERDTVSL